MARTRKLHKKHVRHTRQRREKRRRRTYRSGGFLSWIRGDKANDDQLPKDTETTIPLPNNTDNEGVRMETYIKEFFKCKKSPMFTRYTRRGSCANLRFEKDMKTDYTMSDALKEELLKKITSKIKSILENEYDKKTTPSMIDRIYRSFVKHKDYIIQKAIQNFYVTTYEDNQQFVDIARNRNKIPKNTKERVVFPARLYLTENDRTHLKRMYDSELTDLENPSHEIFTYATNPMFTQKLKTENIYFKDDSSFSTDNPLHNKRTSIL
jgi:hypothetical protein